MMMKAKVLPLNSRVVQDKLLELLIIVDSICRLHNIPYWIDGGTLLGAIRHQGFIPWDDDLDICLMKPDYDRLLIHLQAEVAKSNKLFLFYFEQDDIFFWSEYFGTNELLIQNSKGDIIPCKLDISPMKAIKREDEVIDREITGIANYFNSGKINSYFSPSKEYKRIEEFDSLCKKRDFFINYNSNYMVTNGKPTVDTLINYSYGDSYSKKERKYFEYTDIFPLREIIFEGLMVSCPNEPPKYLEKLYGENYLMPIPIRYQRTFNRLMIPNLNNEVQYSRAHLLKILRKSNVHFFHISKNYYKLKLFISYIRSNGFLLTMEVVVRYLSKKFYTTQR